MNDMPENREQLEIKLILENPKLKSVYEESLKEELDIRRLTAKMEKRGMKDLDKEGEKKEDEDEEEFVT